MSTSVHALCNLCLSSCYLVIFRREGKKVSGQYGEYGGYDFLLIKVSCLQNIHHDHDHDHHPNHDHDNDHDNDDRWRGQCRPNWPPVFLRPPINPRNPILEVMAGDFIIVIFMIMVIMVITMI